MSDTAMYQFNWRQVEESKTVQALTEQWQTVARDLVEDTINREQ